MNRTGTGRLQGAVHGTAVARCHADRKFGATKTYPHPPAKYRRQYDKLAEWSGENSYGIFS